MSTEEAARVYGDAAWPGSRDPGLQVGAPGAGKVSSEPRQGGDGVLAFDIGRLNRMLAGSLFQGRVHHFSTIDSTQTCAVAAAQAGAEPWQVYVADEQTAGRGRGGHTWHSEPGSGLYLTALVRPALLGGQALLLSLAAGLAAQAAIAAVSGVRIDLRWPNDLVTPGPGSLKLGGILTEAAMDSRGRMRYAAIGIGINLHQASMPEELRSVSASLRMLTGAPVGREPLLSELLRQLQGELQGLPGGSSQLLDRFTNGSTWVHGKRVHVAEDEGYTGSTDGMDETGLLRVRCDDGSHRLVRHGGVREMP